MHVGAYLELSAVEPMCANVAHLRIDSLSICLHVCRHVTYYGGTAAKVLIVTVQNAIPAFWYALGPSQLNLNALVSKRNDLARGCGFLRGVAAE